MSGEFMLEVHNLAVSYGARRVIKNLTLSLPRDSILAVIGPNGAGKSTLIRAVSGVQPVEGGTVRIAGRDLASLPPQERARLVAVVPQARNLPPAFTAWETVILGRTPHLNWLGLTSPQDDELVRRAMQVTHTLDLADRRIGEISGGEQQRLLLARALAQSAPLMLLDEPTTHLDLHYQLDLLDQVRSLVHPAVRPPGSPGLTVLLALHDLNLVARYADLVALLVDGELQAFGTPAEVLRPGLLSSAFNVALQVVNGLAGGLPVIIPAGV